MKSHYLLSSLLAALAVTTARSATGPVVYGPDNVYDEYPLTLDPGPVVSGNWTINWGDNGPEDTIPVSQTSVTHAYPTTGSRLVTATLRDGTGKVIDSQYSYLALVRKSGPTFHYNFEDPGDSEHIGPAVVRKPGVTTVASFAGSTGNAVRLAGGGYLEMPEHQMNGADFFGIEFWVKPTNLTTKQMIYAGVGTGTGNVLVYIENNNLCFDLNGSGVVKAVPLGFGVDAGRWHHFAVSYERSPYYRSRNNLRFYRDGLLMKEDTYTGTQTAVAVNHQGATIGAHNTGSISSPVIVLPLSADIDEVVLHPLGVFPGALLERHRAATKNRAAFRITTGADGAPEFTVNDPVITGNTVPVALDPNPAVDNAPIIRAAIAAAPSGTRLQFVDKNTGLGGGTYYLKSGVSGPHVGRIIMLNGKNDIELDGNGVNFLVSSHLTRFVEAIGSTRVSVKNMSFDIDQSKWRSGMYGQVEQVNKDAGNLVIRWVKGESRVPDAIPAALTTNGLWRYRWVSGSTRGKVVDEVYGWNITSKVPDPTDGSLWTLNLNTTEHPPSHGIWNRFSQIKAANDLIQVNNARFIGNAMYAEGCNHLTIDGVWIYGFAGMGILTEKCDYLRVANSKIGLPPGMSVFDRPFSTASDGFHFHNSRNGCLLFENNDIGMTDDDPISLKDQVVVGATKIAANQLQHGGLWTGLMELRKTNLMPLDPPFTGTVTSFDSTTKIATFDTNLPGNINDRFHVLKRFQYSGKYVLRGNNVHDLNGRMMIYSPDGRIENNRFSDLWFHIGFSADSFEGSGEPYNIVLANNLFWRNGSSDAAVWGASPPEPVIHDLGFSTNSFLKTSWNTTFAASPNFTNNYTEQVSGGGNGIFHFKNNTKFATAFGNTHYNPGTDKFATKDASSTVSQGDNELIPLRSTAADVIVDNTSAVFTGTWGTSSFNVGQFYGSNYRWSNTANSAAQFTPYIPETGQYRVYAMWNGGADRGTTVPFTVSHAGGSVDVRASQRTGGGLWVYLGTYTFNAGTAGNVKVAHNASGGLIIADAIRFQQ